MTPLKAIRENCLACCCYQREEVKKCGAKDCPLYPFRLGKNPYAHGRTWTEEEKAVARARLCKKQSVCD